MGSQRISAIATRPVPHRARSGPGARTLLDGIRTALFSHASGAHAPIRARWANRGPTPARSHRLLFQRGRWARAGADDARARGWTILTERSSREPRDV